MTPGPTARAVAVLLAVFLSAGCAQLPSSSSPQALGTLDSDPPGPVVPQPEPGRAPDALVRDFVNASVDPTDAHAAARRFLTADAAADWDDAAGRSIVDKVEVIENSRSETTAEYTVRANRVGELATGGRYVPESGELQVAISLERVDGEWRVSSVPDGITMDRSQFLSVYQNKSVYFPDPAYRTLVPDRRWVSMPPEDSVRRLIELLLEGPDEDLAPSVAPMPSGIALIGDPTKADGRLGPAGFGLGGVALNFSGLAGLSGPDRMHFVAQVVWTLSRADIVGPFLIDADGAPLDPAHADGWTTADVEQFDPTAGPDPNPGVHALVDGVLTRVDPDTGQVTRVNGYFGGEGSNLTSASLSRDGTLVAGVWDTQLAGPSPVDVLVVGSYGGDDAVPVAQGTTIGRPSWQPDGSAVWAVVDSERIIRVEPNRDTGVTVDDVDASAVLALGGPITELRLSRDGARAAVIANGGVYVAMVSRKADGQYELREPRPVAQGYGNDAISLDWSSGETVLVARANGEVPVLQVAMDGSRVDGMPSLNLAMPVVTVEATPTRIYVADSRSVYELDTTQADRAWERVDGLSGGSVVPVLTG